MRLAVLIHEYPPIGGGASTAARNVAASVGPRARGDGNHRRLESATQRGAGWKLRGRPARVSTNQRLGAVGARAAFVLLVRATWFDGRVGRLPTSGPARLLCDSDGLFRRPAGAATRHPGCGVAPGLRCAWLLLASIEAVVADFPPAGAACLAQRRCVGAQQRAFEGACCSFRAGNRGEDGGRAKRC